MHVAHQLNNEEGEKERKNKRHMFWMSILCFIVLYSHVTVSYVYFESFLKPIAIVEDVCE